LKHHDPRLAQAQKNLTERIAKYEERILVTLKGHLAAEQALDGLLKAARRRRKRPFAGKIDVARKLLLPDLTAEMWSVLKAGNNLRNAIAHGDPEGTIAQRIADVRRTLLVWVSPAKAGHRSDDGSSVDQHGILSMRQLHRSRYNES
jgi:hypothetical protein